MRVMNQKNYRVLNVWIWMTNIASIFGRRAIGLRSATIVSCAHIPRPSCFVVEHRAKLLVTCAYLLQLYTLLLRFGRSKSLSPCLNRIMSIILDAI